MFLSCQKLNYQTIWSIIINLLEMANSEYHVIKIEQQIFYRALFNLYQLLLSINCRRFLAFLSFQNDKGIWAMYKFTFYVLFSLLYAWFWVHQKPTIAWYARLRWPIRTKQGMGSDIMSISMIECQDNLIKGIWWGQWYTFEFTLG